MSKIYLDGRSVSPVPFLFDKTPIIIINEVDKKGYITPRGFEPMGTIFTSIYNEYITECEQGSPNDELLLHMMQGITEKEVFEYVQEGKISKSLTDMIKEQQRILPFQIGIYKKKPVLMFAGIRYDLFLYDMFMIRENKIKIRICADCGKAFVPNTKDIYCNNCKRDLPSRNHQKYERRKADVQRHEYTKRYQAIAGRTECKREGFKTYYNIFMRLANDNGKSLEWFKEWDEFDKYYQECRKKITNENSNGYLFDTKEWESKLRNADSKIKSLEDFYSWLHDLEINS